jgi:hypothetical protein
MSMRPSSILRALVCSTFAIALAHSVASAVTPAAGPRNLLANPGFEKRRPATEWMPADWDTSDSGLETVFFGRDSFMVHGGKFSVSVANTSTLFPMGHNWNQALLVGPETWGKTAVFSVWTRSNGLQGRAYLLLQAYRDTISKQAMIWGVNREEAAHRLGIMKTADPLRDLGWRRLQFEDAQTDWVRREARVRVGVGTNVIFVRCGILGTGQVLFDDASLTLVPSPPAPPVVAGQNLLLDPGFEAGGLDWEWSTPPFEGARVERDTTVAHTGRVSMLCSNFRDGLVPARMGACQPLRATQLRGKRVRIGAWFRADSLMNPVYVLVAAHTPSSMKQSGTTEQLAGTFDWKFTATELDVPDDAEELWAWLVVNAPAYGKLWMDDAVLEVVGPAPGKKPAAPPAPARKPKP